MGHSEQSDEEYNQECIPEDQEGLDNYICPADDTFEDEWKGVIYCGRQNIYDQTEPQKIFDRQISYLRTQEIGATKTFGCIGATTLFVTGYYDCDIFNTIADALAQEDERMGGDMTEEEVMELAEKSVQCVFDNFTKWWCPAYTPVPENLGEVEPAEETDDVTDPDNDGDDDDVSDPADPNDEDTG